MSDLDIEDIEKELQEVPNKYYKIFTEMDKPIANIYIIKDSISGIIEIQIYWNKEYITDNTDTNLLEDIRQLIPEYTNATNDTLVQEYFANTKTSFYPKTGEAGTSLFHTKSS